MSESLGDRMKAQYEDRYRLSLPRRTYTVLRLDGRAFHTYTRKAVRPFDHRLMGSLDVAAAQVAAEVDGVQFGYLQSDELSLLLTDFGTIDTQAWFDGNVQKIVSVAASAMTAFFGRTGFAMEHGGVPMFDCRAFVVPDPIEVENYFIWRQKDWLRNSVQMLARAHFSHKELHGKGLSDMHEMLHVRGVNWAHCSDGEKNGRIVSKDDDGWHTNAAPVFTQDRGWLTERIPVIQREATNVA